MKNIQKRKIWLAIWSLMSIIIIFLSGQSVSAALTDTTDLNVLKTAPTGIGIGGFMSNTAPTVPDSTDIYTTNSAQILDRSGNNTANGNIIALASGKNTYGSIWSNNASFDINKPQTVSAWLYFGSGDGSQEINSEGIAFVLQNDSKGIGALGAGLEGLGVYGYDASKLGIITTTAANPSYIQKTAIQNSVALEFDTANSSFYSPNKPINNNGISYPPSLADSLKLPIYYSLDGYDTQGGKAVPSSVNLPGTLKIGAGGSLGHIALAYPGYANTYQSIDLTSNDATKNAYSTWTEGYAMVHVNPQSAYLIDGKDENGNDFTWHHVTITWTPAPSGSTTGTLSYALNDKNMDYSDNTSTSSDTKIITDSIPVDTTKLNSSDGKVRWGFTAANGSSSSVASKLVDLDSIPDSLYADADSDIIDTTLNDKTITDASTDKTVANGDSLKINYYLKYISGNEDWKDIAAKINIPSNVTVTPDSNNNVATITYSDGSTENITASELSDGKLAHTLAKAIGTSSSAGKSATITINAKAVNTTSSNINVAKAVATFNGSNEISSTNSPAFTILATPSYTLDLSNQNSNSEIDLLYKQDNAVLDLPTTLKYSDNHSFGSDTTSTNIVYKITVDGKTYTVGSNATGTSFNQTIDLRSLMDDDTAFWNLFAVGTTNQVTVKAIDPTNGLVSNTITYNVVTKQNKALSMTVSTDLSFQTTNTGNNQKYLSRTSDFELDVTSLREPWKLEVATNGLFLNGQTLNNNMDLVYKANSSSAAQTLTSSPTLIDQDSTINQTATTTDIADDWTQNTGLLVQQSGVSLAGQYTGLLNWTLEDSLVNN